LSLAITGSNWTFLFKAKPLASSQKMSDDYSSLTNWQLKGTTNEAARHSKQDPIPECEGRIRTAEHYFFRVVPEGGHQSEQR
jgi:hypothetical protein